MTGRAPLVAAACAAALAAGAGSASAALPQVDYRLTGTAGSNGWFVSPVALEWFVTGALATSGCDQRYLTADTAGAQYTCTATNDSGSVPATTSPIRIDQTPPSGVTAAAGRGPDSGTWYTRPVAIAWTGADALSGIDACTTLTYAGPDGPAVAPTGSCRDRAGNVSAAVPFPLAYDATPPAVSAVAASFDGAVATLRWTADPDTAHVTVLRQPGDAGAPARTILDGDGAAREATDGRLQRGKAYTWTVTVHDAAGNAASATTTATVPRPPGPPVLRWKAVPRARYYNVQLFRHGRKVLSAWPTQARYPLREAWRFAGRRHRLLAGTYRWYVWPGFGPRRAHRYGKLQARGRVTVP